MPASPAGSLRQQVMQQYAYLFQMAQQLNLALEQLEQAGSGTVRAAGAASGPSSSNSGMGLTPPSGSLPSGCACLAQ
mgnify:CR=1 FL=1